MHGFSNPFSVPEKLAINVAGLVVTIGGGVTLNVVANVQSAPDLGTGAVSGYDSEVISRAIYQTADVSSAFAELVPSLSSAGSGNP